MESVVKGLKLNIFRHNFVVFLGFTLKRHLLGVEKNKINAVITISWNLLGQQSRVRILVRSV